MRQSVTKWTSRALFAMMFIPLTAGCGALPRSRSSSPTLEESAIFHPSRYPEGNWHPTDVVFEDVWFETPDRVHLNGWFAEAKQPRAVVLYMEGECRKYYQPSIGLEAVPRADERLGVDL